MEQTPKKRKYKNLSGPALARSTTRSPAALKVRGAVAPRQPISEAEGCEAALLELPVRRMGADFLACLEKHSTVVLTAETGSGKSTQVHAKKPEAQSGRTGVEKLRHL